MCYIIQVCCFDCLKFKDFKICTNNDYISFIKNNFNEYEESCYYIYDSGGILLDFIDYDDMVG